MAEVKQNVRAEINALEVGAKAPFPKSRYEYVLSCRTKLQTSTGKTFSSEIVGDDVIIERLT